MRLSLGASTSVILTTIGHTGLQDLQRPTSIPELLLLLLLIFVEMLLLRWVDDFSPTAAFRVILIRRWCCSINLVYRLLIHELVIVHGPVMLDD